MPTWLAALCDSDPMHFFLLFEDRLHAHLEGHIFFLRVFGRAYIQIHSLDERLFRDLGYELFDHLNKKKVVVRSSWSSTCIAAMHDS